MNQDAGDTVKQAAGKQSIPAANEPNFDDYEEAFRYGHGARQHYSGREWPELEQELAAGYGGDWKRDQDFIRRSYQSRI